MFYAHKTPKFVVFYVKKSKICENVKASVVNKHIPVDLANRMLSLVV